MIGKLGTDLVNSLSALMTLDRMRSSSLLALNFLASRALKSQESNHAVHVLRLCFANPHQPACNDAT